MSDAITAISESMNTDLLRLRAASQNVTNAGTHGFRAIQFLPVTQSADSTAGNRIPGPENLHEQISMSSGSLQSTGRSLDVALSGNAFFSVMTPAGVQYTRNGSFNLDAEGRLLTAAGFPVLGESGSIALRDASFSVDLDGRIMQEGVVVDRFVLASPADGSEVQSAGTGLYTFKATGETHSARVHQGMLETSNVNVTNEMVRLIELSRHLESVQRAMVTYDRMLDVGINQLGSKR